MGSSEESSWASDSSTEETNGSDQRKEDVLSLTKRKRRQRLDDSDNDSNDDSEEEVESSQTIKKRRENPGIRVVGRRTYDSVLGRTCHWCRQKTVEPHVQCRECPRRFCGACLLNRHGEYVEEEMEKNVRWLCPRCRNGCGPECPNCCNCSFCRKRQNLQPTGQLVQVARKYGFNNVHDYLIHKKTGESPQTIAKRKHGRGWTKATSAVVGPNNEKTMPHSKSKDSLRAVLKEKRNGSPTTVLNDTREGLLQVVSNHDIHVGDVDIQKSGDKVPNQLKNSTLPPAMLKVDVNTPIRVKQELEDNNVCNNESQKTLKGNVDTPIRVKQEPDDRNVCNGESEKVRNKMSGSGCNKESEDVGNKKADSNVCKKESGNVSNVKPEKRGVLHNDRLQNEAITSGEEATPREDRENRSGSSNCGNKTDYASKLNEALQKPFSTFQLKGMLEHVRHRRKLTRMKETRHRTIDVPTPKLGKSYLDLYIDLAADLAKTNSPEEELKVLRGFFFWLTYESMEGSFRPWGNPATAPDDDDVCITSGPDCQIIKVLLAIDDDVEHPAPIEGKPKPSANATAGLTGERRPLIQVKSEPVS